MRKFIKQRAKAFLRGNPRFYQIVLDDLEEQGIRLLKHCGDHSMTFFPNDTVGRHMRASGDFGRDTVKRVKDMLTRYRNLPDALAILELGANVGTHTVYLALEFPTARIAAVEPDIESAELLWSNIYLNALQDRVTVHQVAVSDQPGTMRFIRDHYNRGASSLVQNSKSIAWSDTDELSDGYQEISVDVQTADTIAQTLSQGTVDFVWMDVEGHETNVLLGFHKTIAQSKPAIYFEYNVPRQKPEDLKRLKSLIFENYADIYIDKGGEFVRISEPEFDALNARCDLLLL